MFFLDVLNFIAGIYLLFMESIKIKRKNFDNFKLINYIIFFILQSMYCLLRYKDGLNIDIQISIMFLLIGTIILNIKIRKFKESEP